MTQSDFPASLRRMGYDEHGYRHKVSPKKHLLRSEGNTPAVDAGALGWYYAHGVRYVCVLLTDGRQMVASVDELLRHGKTFEIPGFGRQVKRRQAWITKDARQTSLL